MIILHSMKILEQLTEIESLIKKIENYMDENGIEADREKILEVLMASRIKIRKGNLRQDRKSFHDGLILRQKLHQF